MYKFDWNEKGKLLKVEYKKFKKNLRSLWKGDPITWTDFSQKRINSRFIHTIPIPSYMMSFMKLPWYLPKFSALLQMLNLSYGDCGECTRMQMIEICTQSSWGGQRRWQYSPSCFSQTSSQEGSSRWRAPPSSLIHQESLFSSTLVSPADETWGTLMRCNYLEYFGI